MKILEVMDMKKTICVLLAALMLLGLAACGKQADNTEKNGQVFTGILEEKKDFMIVVAAESGEEAYPFNLGDGVACDAEVGDKVRVTYTGELENFVDEPLIATLIAKVS